MPPGGPPRPKPKSINYSKGYQIPVGPSTPTKPTPPKSARPLSTHELGLVPGVRYYNPKDGLRAKPVPIGTDPPKGTKLFRIPGLIGGNLNQGVIPKPGQSGNRKKKLVTKQTRKR
jgi:hypothetical protein